MRVPRSTPTGRSSRGTGTRHVAAATTSPPCGSRSGRRASSSRTSTRSPARRRTGSTCSARRARRSAPSTASTARDARLAAARASPATPLYDFEADGQRHVARPRSPIRDDIAAIAGASRRLRRLHRRRPPPLRDGARRIATSAATALTSLDRRRARELRADGAHAMRPIPACSCCRRTVCSRRRRPPSDALHADRALLPRSRTIDAAARTRRRNALASPRRREARDGVRRASASQPGARTC